MRLILPFLLLLLLATNCQTDKDLCTCMKEIAEEKKEVGFDPSKPQVYPKGCAFLEGKTADQMVELMDQDCQQELLDIMFLTLP